MKNTYRRNKRIDSLIFAGPDIVHIYGFKKTAGSMKPAVLFYQEEPFDFKEETDERLKPFEWIKQNSELETKKTLAWLKENCFLFENVNIPKNFPFETIQISKRIVVIEEFNLTQYVYIIKQGNMFELAGNDEIGTIIRVRDISSRDKKGRAVKEILGEGDLMTNFSRFLMFIRPQADYCIQSSIFIAGLPCKGRITPVKLIRIPIYQFYNLLFNIKLDLDRSETKKLGTKSGVVSRKPKNKDQLCFFLTVIGEYLQTKLFWEKVRSCSQMTNKTEIKIALLLYQCFMGEFPLRWWRYLDGQTVGDENVDGEKGYDVLQKPNDFITDFILSEKIIAMIIGISEREIKDKLDENGIHFFSHNKKLNEYLSIERKKGRAIYKFYLKFPENIKNSSDVHNLYVRFLEDVIIPPTFSAEDFANPKETTKKLIFTYVTEQLTEYLYSPTKKSVLNYFPPLPRIR